MYATHDVITEKPLEPEVAMGWAQKCQQIIVIFTGMCQPLCYKTHCAKSKTSIKKIIKYSFL